MASGTDAPVGAAGDALAEERRLRREKIALFACCTCPLMGALDGFATNVALPHIGTDFHASLGGLQWVGDAYMLAAASFILSAGALGDRFGRKQAFQFGQLLFVLASAACSLAPNIGALIAFRALQAVGWAFLMPTSLAIITNMFSDRRQRARAIAFWSATGGFGVAAGPILGGLLVSYLGWRSIFVLNIPIGAAAMWITRVAIARDAHRGTRRLDVAGQLLAVGALAVLAYALIEGPDHGWTSPLIASLFGASAVLVVAFITVEHRREDPLVDLKVFKIPSVSGAAFSGFVAFAVINGFLFSNTLLLQDVRGLSPIRTGVAMLPATVMMTIAPRISGRLIAARGPQLPVLISFVVFGLGQIGLLSASVTTPILLLAIPYMLHGSALGLMSPPLTVAAVEAMPVERAGVASGIVLTARQVGSVIGLALLGSVVTNELYGTLPGHLAAAGVKGAAAARVTAEVHAGRFSGYAVPARLEQTVHDVVARTFENGVHWENATALIMVVMGFIVAVATMHRRGFLHGDPSGALGARLDIEAIAVGPEI